MQADCQEMGHTNTIAPEPTGDPPGNPCPAVMSHAPHCVFVTRIQGKPTTKFVRKLDDALVAALAHCDVEASGNHAVRTNPLTKPHNTRLTDVQTPEGPVSGFILAKWLVSRCTSCGLQFVYKVVRTKRDVEEDKNVSGPGAVCGRFWRGFTPAAPTPRPSRV